VCEDQLLPNEFNYIQWYATSGGLGTPESDARHSYYSDNGTGIPDIRFDGSWTALVGAPESYATGEYFMELVEERRLTTSPIAVIISDFSYDEPGAFAEITVEALGNINPASHYIRVAIVEDDLLSGGTLRQNVARTMLPNTTGTPLTVSSPGDEQVLNLDIAMQAAWDPAKLQIIAWVQNDTNKEVIQSGNSFVGEYAAVANVDGPQQLIADGGQVVFGTTSMTNISLNSDTFDISLDTSSLPEGWAAHILYEGMEYQTFSVTLDAFEVASFNVVMDTGTVGSGLVMLDIFSQGAGAVVENLIFNGLAGGTDFLVISDDDQAGHAYTAYAPALDALGKTYAVWERGFETVTGADLLPYDAIIWASGSNPNSLVATDRTALDAYLADGGRLILAGEDLIESLQSQGGSAALWIQVRLRFSLQSGNSGNLQIVGEAGDIIGDGLSFTLTGGDPDQPSLISGQPVEVSARYGNSQPAMLRTTYNDYKIAFIPFGLERVPTQGDRNIIMQRSLQWLDVLEVTGVGDVPGAAMALLQNAPNPFNPFTEIAFRTDQTGGVRLEIFNTRGQLVRVLVDEVLTAGAHTANWDGRTEAGEQAASGTYFYRLSKNGEQMTRKMSLVK